MSLMEGHIASKQGIQAKAQAAGSIAWAFNFYILHPLQGHPVRLFYDLIFPPTYHIRIPLPDHPCVCTMSFFMPV